jgi:TonB family protein
VKSTLDYLMSSKPSGGTKWVLQALLLALGIQVFSLAIVFFTTSSGYSWEAQLQEPAVMEEEIPLLLDEKNEEGVDPSSNQEPMRNVMAQQGGPLGDQVADYSGTQGALSAREYEAQEFERLRKEHAHDVLPQIKKPVNSTPQENPQNVNNNGASSSYQGAVTVEWKMAGRSVSQGPKPTYRCKQAGVVQVNVIIDDKGMVKQANIDPSSSIIDCLREESLSHAKRWKFNAELGKTNQTGTIVFRFAAQ